MTIFGRRQGKMKRTQCFLMFAAEINNLTTWEQFKQFAIDRMPKKDRFQKRKDLLIDVIHMYYVTGESQADLKKKLNLAPGSLGHILGVVETLAYTLIVTSLSEIFPQKVEMEISDLIHKYCLDGRSPDENFRRTYHKYLWNDGNIFYNNGDKLVLSAQTSISVIRAKDLIHISNAIVEGLT